MYLVANVKPSTGCGAERAASHLMAAGFTDPFSAGGVRGHFGINPSSRPGVICLPSEPPLHPTQCRPWPNRVLYRGSTEQQAFAREKLLRVLPTQREGI